MSNFYEQLRAASTPYSNRDEIIHFFKEKYPGAKTLKNGKKIENWKGHLVSAIQPFTSDKNGNPIKKSSLNRRYETGRESSKKISEKQREEYRQLGETLIEVPEGGFHISGILSVKFSDECVEREIDEIYSGADADALLQSSKQELAQTIINIWMHEPPRSGLDPDEEEPGASECQEAQITIEAVA